MPSSFFESTDKLICSNCVNERALKAVLCDLAESARTCFFCSHSPAAPLDVLSNALVNGLQNEFEVVGYLGNLYDKFKDSLKETQALTTWELIKCLPDDFWAEPYLLEKGDTFFHRNPVLNEVYKAVEGHLWTRKGGVGPLLDDALTASWAAFSETVKHKTRFVLWRIASDDRDEAGAIPPSQILDRVQDLIVDHNLIDEIPAGTCFWRARTHDQPAIINTASELGTAPPEKALTGNRMSPAGISRFYGADDADTAVLEAAQDTDHNFASYGRFEVTSDVLIVDFTRVPEVPSMFDPRLGAFRRELSFLNGFANELSQPVKSVHREFEYVPTQIVSEYLLQVTHESDPIIGLKFNSSLTDRPCVALDIPNQRCVDDETDEAASLKLLADSVECRPIGVGAA